MKYITVMCRVPLQKLRKTMKHLSEDNLESGEDSNQELCGNINASELNYVLGFKTAEV
jgi:hypothetical protein